MCQIDIMSDLKQRRAEEKEQRRETLIDAAERVFANAGFDAATMEEVARVARVSRALVYLYFKNKDELHCAVCERALRLLHERFLSAAASAGRGYDKVVALGRAYMAFAEEFPCYFMALSRFEARAPETVVEGSLEHHLIDCGRAVHQVTVDCLLHGVRDGSIRADLEDPLLAALSLWAFTHGLIQLMHSKKHFFSQVGISTARFAEYAIDFAMRGLHPRAAKSA
ncbi:transcriptional regulator, TetR family [Fontimonas thermophila]|uniref:Transcriptional regulator, TetR family n=2 Tax=Fontimonas thermophila TaxID=1076937 RepID=A0A1I2JIH8_9GAMM|nr:transcriptional regulator, TetR family [Fontimonas thermophila]